MAAHSFHVLFRVVFQKFYTSYKNLYISSIFKILATGLEPATIRLLPRLYAIHPSKLEPPL